VRRLRRRARGLRLRQGAVAHRGERAARRLLLVAPHASYRTAPYIEAAQAAGVEPFLLCARSALDLPAHIAGAVHDAGDTDTALRIAAERHSDLPFDGVCVTDDATAELGARIARHLGLNGNDPAAAALTNDKLRARRRLADAGVASPDFACIDLRDRSAATSARPSFPLVVKPLSMSASRGVIRVDDEAALIRALDRIERLLAREFAEPDFRVLVERYIPGFEVAVEGLLTGGILEVLAVFDKPDPLTGPYFEETYYTTPSRLCPDIVERIGEGVQGACGALGLVEGPVHAECRVNAHGVWPLEVAARTIGGKCARLLTFATGRTLEEIVIAHAVGEKPGTAPVRGGAGVLMVPVPASGVVRRVEGIGEARRVPGIEEVEIDVGTGQVISAWPEGGAYPGFVFSRGATPLDAEMALRRACALIRIVVAPLLV